MKKLIGAMSLVVLTANYAQAEEWTFLAGFKDGYVANPVVSVIAGQQKVDVDGLESASVMGVEFSLNCPLIQPPTNRIRQQISLAQYSDNGFTANHFEINPHYVVEVLPKLEIGGGPGFGFITTDGVADEPSFLAFQLGLSAHYFGFGPGFVGAEWRYQMTTEENIDSGSKDNLNNWRAAVKVGYAF